MPAPSGLSHGSDGKIPVFVTVACMSFRRMLCPVIAKRADIALLLSFQVGCCCSACYVLSVFVNRRSLVHAHESTDGSSFCRLGTLRSSTDRVHIECIIGVPVSIPNDPLSGPHHPR